MGTTCGGEAGVGQGLQKTIQLLADYDRFPIAIDIPIVFAANNRRIVKMEDKQPADYRNRQESTRNRMGLLRRLDDRLIEGAETIDHNRSKYERNRKQSAKRVSSIGESANCEHWYWWNKSLKRTSIRHLILRGWLY